METIDRYLKAVRSCLPAGQKDDIIRELSEDIHSRMEEKGSELGRPLTEADIETILKGYGHPLLVAGRFRQDDRAVAFGKQLIGPVLFPFYTKVLSFNLGITSAVLVFIFSVLIASGQPLTLLKDLPTVFLYQLLIQFATVTMIFIGVDRHLNKHPNRWNPRNPNHAYYVNLTSAELQEPATVSRIESVSKLIGLAVLIVWLRVIQQSPFLVLGPLAASLRFAPVWHEVYLPVLLVIFLGMAQAGINLAWPTWVTLRSASRLVSGAAVLAIWAFLFKSGPWIVSGDNAANFLVEHSRTLEIVNQCFYYALLAAVILSAGQLLVDLYRLVRGTPHRAPSRA
jgi:hypothetical protein